MKIVVLDGFTMNPGDLSWVALKELGDTEIYQRTPGDKVLQRAHDADIVLTNKTVLDRTLIEQLPQLKYIGVIATGYNVIDVEAAKARNITVTNVPAYCTEAVAQTVFAHILNLTQHVGEHAASVRAGKWCKSKDFSFWDFKLIELEGLTLGIIGYGKIGQAVAKLAQAFGMKLLVNTRTPPTDSVTSVSCETVFAQSDFLSLHCPLTDETVKLVNRDKLELMKNTAFLINTSRGQLIDEAALAEALNSGVIAGAGLDVLDAEPPPATSPLLDAKNCYITPHIAWATRNARQRLFTTTVNNIRAYLDGTPQNKIN